MTSSRFEVSHDILIDARPAVAFDYLSDPASWPKWHPTSHHVDCPGHPLGLGASFHERWQMRSGIAELNWLMTACDRSRLWRAEADTSFIGCIIAGYGFVARGTRTHYTRRLINPARQWPPTVEMCAQIEEEARICFIDIKARIEQRAPQAS